MALDTYANLKAAIRDWSHRSDMPDSRIDDYIDMAESKMWQELRINDMIVRSTAAATGTRYIAKPTGFLKMRELKAVTGGVETDINFAAEASLQSKTGSGLPRYFSIGSQIAFDILPSATYTFSMNYWAELTALSDSNKSNAALSRFPAIYLYGALYFLNKFAGDSKEATNYYKLFMDEIKTANKSDSKGIMGPVPTMRYEGMTP